MLSRLATTSGIVAGPTAIRTEEPPVSKLREESGWAFAVLAGPHYRISSLVA